MGEKPAAEEDEDAAAAKKKAPEDRDKASEEMMKPPEDRGFEVGVAPEMPEFGGAKDPERLAVSDPGAPGSKPAK